MAEMIGTKALNEAFLQTLNPNPAVLRKAEGDLRVFTKQPGYAMAILTLISLDTTAVEIRQAAAVSFKNFVKNYWAQDENADITMPDEEKEGIKALLIRLMLNSPAPVRAQLSEALTIIGTHDFPAKWPTLLPELLQHMQTGNPQTVSGILETGNSIFKRYRNQMMSEKLNKELIYIQQMVQPLLDNLQKLARQLESATQAQNVMEAKTLLTCIRLNLRIFYSFNSPGLTEDFEKTLDAWMEEFHKLLTYAGMPGLTESKDDSVTPVDAVKAAVCQNINLLVNRDEEEFSKFLSTFVGDVWTLLMTLNSSIAQEPLTMSAIQFLTTVAKSPVNNSLFRNEGVLQQICERIIVPNLKLNEDLEEMFEMNYVEYLRRDTEGSDYDTRRRAATELVKALNSQFLNEVTHLFTQKVTELLSQASSAREANWKDKDAAMYLVTALAVQGKTAEKGATATNQAFNIKEFYQSQVLPELQARPDAKEILQADALKYVTTFRSHLSKADLMGTLSLLANLLGSQSNVVHSYAAILLERLLASKENGAPRFAVAELMPYLQGLLGSLFAAFSIPDSAENEYVMKCVMRVISFVGPEIAPAAPQCLEALKKLLMAVCRNPTVPGFSHYLFESVAALISNSAAAQPETVATLEGMLFPPFEFVLQNDVQEFHPYVFQIFSQMIELRSKPLPANYLGMVRPLLTPDLWERHGNVPALTRLMRAYLAKAATDIVHQNLLEALLGVFQRLLAGKSQDHEGFKLLRSIFEFVPESDLAKYTTTVYTVLFQRLQAAKTTKYVGGLLTFLSWLINYRSVQSVEQSIEQVQGGLFRILLEQVWVPSMGAVGGSDQRKTLQIASTKILCDSQTMQAQNATALWGQMLKGLIAELDTTTPSAAAHVDDDEEDEEFTGYSAAFARLHNAALREPDSLPSTQNPAKFLADSLAQLSKVQPGRVQQLIQTQVPPEGQQILQTFCQQAGVAIS